MKGLVERGARVEVLSLPCPSGQALAIYENRRKTCSSPWPVIVTTAYLPPHKFLRHLCAHLDMSSIAEEVYSCARSVGFRVPLPEFPTPVVGKITYNHTSRMSFCADRSKCFPRPVPRVWLRLQRVTGLSTVVSLHKHDPYEKMNIMDVAYEWLKRSNAGN